MWPTAIRRDQYMTTSMGKSGVQPWKQRVEYDTYKSKYGPQYKAARHIKGFNMVNTSRFAYTAGLFGVSAGIFAIFFFDGVPRVRKDILQKVPLIGGFFVHEIAPEDNPF